MLLAEKKEDIKRFWQEGSNSSEVYVKISQAERELENLLKEEESYWKMRAREDLLKIGDKNTKWFHAKASNKKRKNEIKGIVDENGQWVISEEEIGTATTSFFKKLLISSNPSSDSILEVTNCIKKKISIEKSRMLDSPFTKDEIDEALKGMNPTRAPGPDGAHTMFFQR